LEVLLHLFIIEGDREVYLMLHLLYDINLEEVVGLLLGVSVIKTLQSMELPRRLDILRLEFLRITIRRKTYLIFITFLGL